MCSGPSAGQRAHFGRLPRCSSNLSGSSCSLSLPFAGHVISFSTVTTSQSACDRDTVIFISVGCNFHFYNNVLWQSFIFYLHAQRWRSLIVFELRYDRPPQRELFCVKPDSPCSSHKPTFPPLQMTCTGWGPRIHSKFSSDLLGVRQVQEVSCYNGRLGFPNCPSFLSPPLICNPVVTLCKKPCQASELLESGICGSL